ncbi:MAG TPA: sigma factor-like helix-turn-helix DNA-binding protein, partial [Burkholderiaceae bacterium]|nr:sigma factor-like helix-turn-helix DNA-binding protein [Burkholderiaceae bacterium]
VLYLSFAQGLSHAEIAAQLDIPLGTAKSLIRRALMELKQRLEPASMAGVSSTVTRGGAVAASVN